MHMHTLCIIYLLQTCEMYTEDDNTVLKEMQDKSQLQTEPCVERQLQTTQTQVQTTQTNQEPQTPGEGQLFTIYCMEISVYDTLMCILAHDILKFA